MSTKARAVRSRYSSPWVYFALTLGWSWVFWIAAAILGNSFDSLLTVLLFAVGGLGPAIVAISLTYLTLGSEGLRDYWLRVIDFKRIGLRWYIAAHPIGDVFPPGSIRFWLDFAVGTAFAGPVLMTWIYNNTGRSTLSAIRKV